MGRPRAYLAGPDVFLPNRVEHFAAKVAICESYDLDAAPPLDSGRETGAAPLSRLIYQRNIDLMDGADLIIANLTPFRGPGADAGTVFELGYGLARALPIFGYSNDPRLFFERTTAFAGPMSKGADGRSYASDGLAAEDFGLADNLMIDHALEATGGVIRPTDGKALDFTDLSEFERCVAQAAAHLAAATFNSHRHAAG